MCPVAPVVPAEMRAELTDMSTQELRALCGKLEDGKKTFFAGDSLTLQVHNELICLCGVKTKRKSVFVNLKGLSGSTVAQTFPNCARYIHQHERRSTSQYVPDDDGAQTTPTWKRIDMIQPFLPTAQQDLAEQAGGTITGAEYTERLANGTR